MLNMKYGPDGPSGSEEIYFKNVDDIDVNVFRQRIILSEKKCSFTDSFNCSNRFKSQYNVKCVGDLKLILALIFKTSAVIN